MKENLNSILVMKVGPQTGQDGVRESLQEILERKNGEASGGIIYWGYGGSTCRPLRVQEFTRENSVKVLFIETKSPFHGGHIPDAKSFSADNLTWDLLPVGTHVTASKYALLLKDIMKVDFVLGLNEYEIPLGPSKEKPLSEYLVYQADKAIARHIDRPRGVERSARISYIAELVSPCAVFLK